MEQPDTGKQAAVTQADNHTAGPVQLDYQALQAPHTETPTMIQGTRQGDPRALHAAHHTIHPAPRALQDPQDQEAQVATTLMMAYSEEPGETGPQAHQAPRGHQGHQDHQADKINQPETKIQMMAYPGNAS